MGSLVMTAAICVTAEVDHFIAVLSMADAQMGYAAMAGWNLRIVRQVCTNSDFI